MNLTLHWWYWLVFGMLLMLVEMLVSSFFLQRQRQDHRAARRSSCGAARHPGKNSKLDSVLSSLISRSSLAILQQMKLDMTLRAKTASRAIMLLLFCCGRGTLAQGGSRQPEGLLAMFHAFMLCNAKLGVLFRCPS